MRRIILPLLAAGALGLAGCASNYAGEGAGGGALLGAGVAGLAGGDVVTGAAVGAAAGAVVGSQVEKDRGCYRYNSRGKRYWDRDC